MCSAHQIDKKKSDEYKKKYREKAKSEMVSGGDKLSFDDAMLILDFEGKDPTQKEIVKVVLHAYYSLWLV